MKKLYSTIMLLAMMVAAVSLTACGGDDDEDNGGGGSLSDPNYLEVSIDGTKHKQVFNLPFVAVTLPSDVESGLWLSSSVEEQFDGDLDFGIAIYHKSNLNALLQSGLTIYNVIGNKKSVWQQADEIHNLTLQIAYRNGHGNCEVINGTHKVTSIKKKNNDAVVISGTFEASLKDNSSSYEVSGKYQVTIAVE